MTTQERVIKRIVEGINRAFQGLEVTTVKIEVKATDREPERGGGIRTEHGSGFVLTIAGRQAEFSGEGLWLGNVEPRAERTEQHWAAVKDRRPGAYANFCRGTITEAELFKDFVVGEETPAETKKGEATGLAEKGGKK